MRFLIPSPAKEVFFALLGRLVDDVADPHVGAVFEQSVGKHGGAEGAGNGEGFGSRSFASATRSPLIRLPRSSSINMRDPPVLQQNPLDSFHGLALPKTDECLSAGNERGSLKNPVQANIKFSKTVLTNGGTFIRLIGS